MSSLNKVMLIGNLGADPELKHVGDNRAVCSLSLATNESYKGKDGARVEKVEWHRITVWGDQAESCAKYLSKGRSVYVEGRLQTRSYEKDGQKRYATDIVADRVTFLGGGNDRGGSNTAADAPNTGRRGNWGEDKPAPGNAGDGGDDIPF